MGYVFEKTRNPGNDANKWTLIGLQKEIGFAFM